MPGLKNKLSLHEAIVIALININKKNFSATFEEIAHYIEKYNLFENRKGNISLLKQIELRSTKSKGAYLYLFKQIDESSIQLCLTSKSSIESLENHQGKTD